MKFTKGYRLIMFCSTSGQAPMYSFRFKTGENMFPFTLVREEEKEGRNASCMIVTKC